ncbi:MAG: immunoglobulin-like domain-containing protein [Bacteroidia bacterium]
MKKLFALLLVFFVLHLMVYANQKPIALFSISHTSGLVTDTFRFINQTINNPTNFVWTFTPGSVVFVNNTNANSANPQVIFVSTGSISVRLIAINSFGSDTLFRANYIQTYNYTNPQSFQSATQSFENISILRVVLPPGIDTITSPMTPDYLRILGNQQATLFRGKRNGLTVHRVNNTSPAEFRVWIDFNRNGNFENNELVLNKSNVMQREVTDSFFIPSNQPLAYTFMRVLVALNHPTLTPNFTQMGVYRDYRINIANDTVRPTIVLNSSSILYGQVNLPFFDPMATAFDNIEGDISHRVKRIGFIDTSSVGNYTLKYFVNDLYNNVSDTLLREVFITLNQTAPRLNLLGDSLITIEVNTRFNEPGYTAFDNTNLDITQFVVIGGNLDTSNVGFYTVLYTITDAFNRTTVARRYVRVVDTQKPVIRPIQGNPHIHAVFKPIDIFNIVNVTDNSLKPMLPLAFGSVNPQILGNYNIVYKAYDQSNNEADSLVLTVSVVDTIKPTLRDTSLQLNRTIEVFTPFTLQTPLFDDNYWPVNTLRINQSGNVNTNRLGTYTVVFTCEDPSGNVATVTFNIRVVDSTKPIISIIDNPVKGIALNVAVKPDTPLVLTDNYDSEAFLFSTLVVTYPFPLNANGELLITQPGLYSINYQCRDSSMNLSDIARYNFSIGSLGLSNVDNVNSIKVYPNPANSFVIIEPNGLNIDVINITDIRGKIIKQFITENKVNIKLDITGINTGMYILEMIGNDNVYFKKLLIE